MSVHEKPVGATVEWYTPPELFELMDTDFNMDPAMPESGAEWVPAAEYIRRPNDGLAQPWIGSVWLNPPYGRDLPRFVNRMVGHGDGVMLVPARTETAWFQHAAKNATAINFLSDRIHFIRDDGVQARASFGSVLMAFGHRGELTDVIGRVPGLVWAAGRGR